MRALLLIAAAILLLAGVAWFMTTSRPHAKPAAASPGAAAAPAGESGAAANRRSSAPPRIAPPPPPTKSAGEVVLRGAWGSGPGEFGRRREQESNPEAPMAIAAGGRGDFAVVDQINRRVQRFHDGKMIAAIPIGGDTVQDLALGPNGRTLLLDRLADRNVQVYDSSGKLSNEVSLVGPGVKEGGAVTGVFADDSGIYVESDHATVVRIADPDGKPDANRPQLLGRPTRDGRLLVTAAIAARGAAEVTVSAVDRASGQPSWSTVVPCGAPILHLVMLDSDKSGQVYVAADVGDEAPAPPFQILNERIVVTRLGSGGAPRGAITVPPFPTADETFRPMSVDDDGSILVMVAGERGLEVVRYTFP